MPKSKDQGSTASGSGHSLNLSVNARAGFKGGRTAATIKRLRMYKTSGAKRDKRGKIVTPAAFQSHVECGTRARVEPSR